MYNIISDVRKMKQRDEGDPEALAVFGAIVSILCGAETIYFAVTGCPIWAVVIAGGITIIAIIATVHTVLKDLINIK